MIIRKAGLKDAESIVSLWEEFMKEHDDIVTKENPKIREFIIRKENASDNYEKFLKKNIKSKNGEVYVAEVDDLIVGYALIFVKDEIPVFKIKKIGYVSDLYVKKQFRSRRISSKLFENSKKWFRKKGLKYISLGMYPDNKSAYFIYKKWGFFDYHLDLRMKI